MEEVLGVLEKKLLRENLMVIPMESDSHGNYQFISKSKETHFKAIEVGIACATALSVVGTGIGFIIYLGPVFWGLLSAFIGFFTGYFIYTHVKKFKPDFKEPEKHPEVIVIAQCSQDNYSFICEVMWKYKALSVGKYMGKRE